MDQGKASARWLRGALTALVAVCAALAVATPAWAAAAWPPTDSSGSEVNNNASIQVTVDGIGTRYYQTLENVLSDINKAASASSDSVKTGYVVTFLNDVTVLATNKGGSTVAMGGDQSTSNNLPINFATVTFNFNGHTLDTGTRQFTASNDFEGFGSNVTFVNTVNGSASSKGGFKGILSVDRKSEFRANDVNFTLNPAYNSRNEPNVSLAIYDGTTTFTGCTINEAADSDFPPYIVVTQNGVFTLNNCNTNCCINVQKMYGGTGTLKIDGGTFSSNNPQGEGTGSAIYCSGGSSVEASNCIVDYTIYFSTGSTGNLKNVQLSVDNGTNRGGLVVGDKNTTTTTKVTATECIFKVSGLNGTNGSEPSAEGGIGAIDVGSYGDLTMDSCTVTSDSIAISMYGGTNGSNAGKATLTGCTVSNDNTKWQAISMSDGTNLTISNSTITSDESAGVFVGDGANLTVNQDTTISGASFGISTNGLDTKSSTISITDSTVTNTRNQTAAIYLPSAPGEGSQPDVLTVSGKSVIQGGAGIVSLGSKVTIDEDTTNPAYPMIIAMAPNNIKAGDYDGIGEGTYPPAAVVSANRYLTPTENSIQLKGGSYESTDGNPSVAFINERATTAGNDQLKSIQVTGGEYSEPVNDTYLGTGLNYQATDPSSITPYSYHKTPEAAEQAKGPGGQVTQLTPAENGAVVRSIGFEAQAAAANNTIKAALLAMNPGTNFQSDCADDTMWIVFKGTPNQPYSVQFKNQAGEVTWTQENFNSGDAGSIAVYYTFTGSGSVSNEPIDSGVYTANIYHGTTVGEAPVKSATIAISQVGYDSSIGQPDGLPESGTYYQQGTPLTLPVLAMQGYTFRGWTANVGQAPAPSQSGGSWTYIVPDSGQSVELTAQWTQNGSTSGGGSTSKPTPEEQLQTAVDKAISQYGTTNDGKYTFLGWQGYDAALKAAQQVLADPNATDEQIQAANQALTNAIKGLLPLTVQNATTELQGVIDQADALTESDYTPESWQALAEALDAAEALLANPEATAEQLDQATQAVASAIAALVPAEEPEPGTDTVDVYRVLNPDTQEHLYTKDLNEYNALTTRYGWEGENVAWTAPTTSSTPIYRLRHPGGGHLYTTSLNEYEYLDRNEAWVGEGIALYSAPATDSVPIYRLYNPQYFIGFAHLWTADLNEYTYQGSHGWDQEDVAFYAITAPGM